MTNQRTLAGRMALEGDAPLGDPNWDAWNDPNLIRLSSLAQLTVLSRTATIPGTLTDGDLYIDPATNQVLIRDNGVSILQDPWDGLWAFVVDTREFVFYDGVEEEWAVGVSAGMMSSGGSGAFADLSDTPSSFTGQAGRRFIVNPAEDGLILEDIDYSLPVFVAGLPTEGALLTRYLLNRQVTFAENFAQSLAMVGVTASDGPAIFSIRRNGTEVNTLTFTAGAPGGTFGTTTSETVFNVGSALEIVYTGTADSTLSDLSITLTGIQS